MKLSKLKIEGFRRIRNAEIQFGDATFLIGANNAGKSSTLIAIDYLLSSLKQIPPSEFYSEIDPETGSTIIIDPKVVFEAEFRNLPEEARNWRGFKGRVFSYAVPEGQEESGLSIFYRKTYEVGKEVVIELKSRKRSLKAVFEKLKKPSEFISAGIDEGLVKSLFEGLDKNIAKADANKLQAIDDIWDISDDEEWFVNPGGIPGNVLNKLPKFLFIPAEPSIHEIQDAKKGVLGKTLSELFEEVRDRSPNYLAAQTHLNNLAAELDPADSTSEFGRMMSELNDVLSGVFPEAQLHAVADLSNPDKVLVPSFDIQMSSNVKTSVDQQGTGMVRSAVFGLLRYRQNWLNKRADNDARSLIIGFEEPEIYLHPSAANQMRDAIYALSSGSSQIVATTHSPYMIDISRNPRQILNKFSYVDKHSNVVPFSVTDEYKKLEDNNKNYVKMLLKFDDYVARAFFTKKVVIVEGDTEDIVIREAIRRLPDPVRNKINTNFEVIKARGKGAIIGLAKYFNALGVDYHVIHDRDSGVADAEKFNVPIATAVGNSDKVTQLHECVEDVLGYAPPSSEKPYKAFVETTKWADDWSGVPKGLADILKKVFSPLIP